MPLMTPARFARVRREATKELLEELGDALAARGGTVIPDGASIQGTYTGSVLCLGDATVSGTLLVEGDLIVVGDLINAEGWEVTTKGDLFATRLLFNRENTDLPQGDLTVAGNLVFASMNFVQTADAPAQLSVGGDIKTKSPDDEGSVLDGSGLGSTAGLNVSVTGNVSLAGLDVRGGSNETGYAGNGGNVFIQGSMVLAEYFNGCGGDAIGGNGGAGSRLEVHGSLEVGFGSVLLHGGNATDGNGGLGGDLSVDGNLITNELELYGGNCTSDSDLYAPGAGGEATIDGQLTLNDYANLSGGNHFGTLTQGGETNNPDGGYLAVYGGAICDGDLDLRGGSVFTGGGYSSHYGGQGGNINIRGDLTVTSDIDLQGGFVTFLSGGNGGFLGVEGNCLVDGDLSIDGGTSDNGHGGSAGSLNIDGSLQVRYLSMNGGGATQGNGGSGGEAYIGGVLIASGSVELVGGSCTSTNEFHSANGGGYLQCMGYIGTDNDLRVSGGNRFGATTGPNTGNAPANSGNLSCYGNFTGYAVYLEGGGVQTNFPNSPGGSGGSLYVDGSLTLTDTVRADGGDAAGNAGGAGGYVRVMGNANPYRLYLRGGAATDSPSGTPGDAGPNGHGGSAQFTGGITCQEALLTDGAGSGAAATGDSRIGLGGSCCFGTLALSDRSESWIYAHNLAPALLKINTLGDKVTLNTDNGTPSSDISADLGASLFVSGPSSNWYTVTGTIITD